MGKAKKLKREGPWGLASLSSLKWIPLWWRARNLIRASVRRSCGIMEGYFLRRPRKMEINSQVFHSVKDPKSLLLIICPQLTAL